MPVWASGAAWAKETSLSMLPARIRPAPLAVARRYHGLSGPYAVASAAKAPRASPHRRAATLTSANSSSVSEN